MQKKNQIAQNDFSELLAHRYPKEEIDFYISVVKGDMEAVTKNCQTHRFLDMEGVGVLSQDPLCNIKYHYVITAAMLTRLCMDNGLDWELSYQMSDRHIQQLDNAFSIQAVQNYHDEMVLDFTKRMQQLQKKDKYCIHVSKCKNYIYAHVSERITVDDIAEHIGVSTSYLSRLFKQETGMSVSDYVRNHKMDVAMNLLKYSDYPVINISNHLAFSSQSHFIQQFHKYTGMTPKKYREQHYMKVWDVAKNKGESSELPNVPENQDA